MANPVESLVAALPPLVRRRAEEAGPPGQAWLAALPELTAALTSKWAFEPQDVIAGGSEAFVIGGQIDADGRPAVIKIGLPTDCDCVHEAGILEQASGHGFVELFDLDEDRNALLLERLGGCLGNSSLTEDERMAKLLGAMQRAWVEVDDPEEAGMMSGGAKARWLANFIESTWAALDEPCPRGTIEVALDFCQDRDAAHNPATARLVHADAHETNALFTLDGDDVKLIDPDGLFAEPACDLATLMRDYSSSLAEDPLGLGIARSEKLAAMTGIDETAIWQWGMMERVSTALMLLKLELTEEGHEMMAVANIWSER